MSRRALDPTEFDLANANPNTFGLQPAVAAPCMLVGAEATNNCSCFISRQSLRLLWAEAMRVSSIPSQSVGVFSTRKSLASIGEHHALEPVRGTDCC